MEDDCLCTALRQAALASTAMYDAALEPSGLKVTMYRLLRRAAEGEPPSLSELARRMGLERSTLGRNAQVLVRDGMIALVPADDGRERTVVLTAKGRKALATAIPLWRTAQRDLDRRLGARGRELLDVLATLEPSTGSA